LIVCSTSEQISATWWTPRADVGGRPSVMYRSASLARSALIAFRSISVMAASRITRIRSG
jgi:hypothetical protein